MANGLHSASRRSKTENRTGNRTSEFFQETQSELNTVAEVMRDERPGKEFRGGLCRGHGQQLIVLSLFEEKDCGESNPSLRGHPGVAVPRCAVHPERVVLLAKNDAVVAEKFCARLRHPQACGGALPCARVAEKQIAAAIFVGEAQGVNLHAFAESQAMHHDQFVDGIFQREYWRIRIIDGALQNDMTALKLWVEPGGFVGGRTKCWTGEVEGGAEWAGKGRPESTGDKRRRAAGSFQRMRKVGFEFNITGKAQARRQQERVVFLVDGHAHAGLAPHPNGQTTNFEGNASGRGKCGLGMFE